MRQGNLARHAESVWAQHADAPPLSASDYAFLLERFVDRATLHRAEALAKKWGVLPHAVMIANGWLSASDYYRALAQACGVPFRGEIGPDEVTAPASLKSPGQCRDRGGAGPSPAHQAKGAQLCAAARPRRISRHL